MLFRHMCENVIAVCTSGVIILSIACAGAGIMYIPEYILTAPQRALQERNSESLKAKFEKVKENIKSNGGTLADLTKQYEDKNLRIKRIIKRLPSKRHSCDLGDCFPEGNKERNIIKHMAGNDKDGIIIDIDFGEPGEDSRLVMNENGNKGWLLMNPNLKDHVLRKQVVELGDMTMGHHPLKSTTFVCREGDTIESFSNAKEVSMAAKENIPSPSWVH